MCFEIFANRSLVSVCGSGFFYKRVNVLLSGINPKHDYLKACQ